MGYKLLGWFCRKCQRLVTNDKDSSCIMWKKENERDVVSHPYHDCGTILEAQFDEGITDEEPLD